MARSVKRPRPEPQAFHQLGVRGRKTGVVLHDRGERDEHGMQPLDSIFSPHEGKTSSSVDEALDDAGSGEMDIASSDGPGPQTLLKNRHSITYPLPKSRSPIKTHLNSPAKKNPHLDHLSSPSRSGLTGDPDVTVTRRLDFTGKSEGAKRLSGQSFKDGKKSPPPSLQRLQEQDEGSDEEQGLMGDKDPTVSDLVNESMNMIEALKSDNFVGGQYDNEPDYDLPSAGGKELPEEIHEQSPVQALSIHKSSPLPPSRRPPLTHSIYSATKKRPSLEVLYEADAPQQEEPSPRQTKKQRTVMPPPPRPGNLVSRASKATLPISKSKSHLVPKPEVQPVKRGRGRPRKMQRPLPRPEAEDEGEGDESFMEIQRGPPMPRSRGLVSFRNDGTSTNRPQLGQHSSRKPDLWGNAYLEQDSDGGARDIIRVAQDAPPSKRAPRSNTRRKAKQIIHQAALEDEELEDWEVDEGIVMGDIVIWEPEHESFPPGDDEEVQVTQDRLAIAADALQVQEIPDATFRFAKTLTMPFMGAGVVDLPPESVKRAKNSRKMHMVFFVHYGKVLVTINEVQFRITAGGTWFVPRGNYYSISNDYEVPARIFFAQACEVAAVLQHEVA